MVVRDMVDHMWGLQLPADQFHQSHLTGIDQGPALHAGF